MTNIFTVDLEDWFHVCGVERARRAKSGARFRRESATRRAGCSTCWMPLGVRATFFVVGWVADEHPQLVAAVRSAGHDIGSHGHDHLRAYDLTADAFAADLRKSVAALRSAGVPRRHVVSRARVVDQRSFALGAGDAREEGIHGRRQHGAGQDRRLDRRTLAILTFVRPQRDRLSRFRRSSSIGSGRSMPLGWGWGLRMSSPAAVLRRIEEVNRAGSPAVLAVHPWEFDLDPPKVRLPASLHFAHYFRLDGFRNRLRSILESATFGPISTLAPGPVACNERCCWLPLARISARRSQQPGQAVAGAVAAHCRRRQRAGRCGAVASRWPRTSLCRSPCACTRLPPLMRALRSTRSSASYRRSGVPVWLTVPAPASVQDAEAWRQRLAALLEQHGDGIAIVEVAVSREQAGTRRVRRQTRRDGSAVRAIGDSHRNRRIAG